MSFIFFLAVLRCVTPGKACNCTDIRKVKCIGVNKIECAVFAMNLCFEGMKNTVNNSYSYFRLAIVEVITR